MLLPIDHRGNLAETRPLSSRQTHILILIKPSSDEKTGGNLDGKHLSRKVRQVRSCTVEAEEFGQDLNFTRANVEKDQKQDSRFNGEGSLEEPNLLNPALIHR